MRWRALQNALTIGALGALLSQSTFAQLPGTHLSPGMRSAGVAAILDCIGGTVSYSGGNTIHKFTTAGSNDFYCPTTRTVNYLLVAGGGGGGGTSYSGGGGAGGMLSSSGTLNVGTSTVIVGAGGTGGAASARGTQGSNSSIITPGGAGSWFAVTPSYTITAYGSGWTGYGAYTRFLTTNFAGSAPAIGTQLRVTVAGLAGANAFTSIYCGHAGAGGTTSYDGTQVQIKFGGNANVALPTYPSTTVSDAVNYSFSSSKDIVCGVGWNSGGFLQVTPTTNQSSQVPGGGASVGLTAGGSTINQANFQFGPFVLLEAFSTSTIVASATGGGGGGSYSSFVQGGSGGSAGGGSYGSTSAVAGTAGQGNAGGFYATGGSGGGGAGAAGANGTSTQAGNGGAGLASTITGASVIYAAGAAGGAASGQAAGTGGSSIGGNGGAYSAGTCTNGAANTGSGGGGISASGTACNGGSGVVVISYPSGAPNVNCIGGTVTTSGSNTVHSFTTPGSATISCVTGKAINYLVVAGGGGGGGQDGAGGGAGGALTGTGTYLAPDPTTITVGAGGIGGSSATGSNGANSLIVGIVAAVGGGGGKGAAAGAGNVGGSAGGSSNSATVAAGTTGQGSAGGAGATSGNLGAGGGGGATAAGGAGTTTVGGIGGAGLTSTISGSSVCYAGGGGGALVTTGSGGTATCGGGAGVLSGTANNGTANTGGGGGGQGATSVVGGTGGSGVVIVSYVTDSTQAPPAGTWKPLITTQSPPSLGSGFTNYHLRTRYNTAAYVAGVANSGNIQIRVTVTGGGTTTNSFNAMYCGHAVAADPSMDFDGSQVQIRFSGNANLSLPSGTIVSDAVNYAFDKTKAFICSYNWAASSVVYGTTTGPAGINMGSAAGTGANAGVSAAGFNVTNTSYNSVATQIEVFGP
jgi:hypothetical protein